MSDIKLLPEVEQIEKHDLVRKAIEKATRIVKETPPDSDWDDPEEWQVDAAELAHIVMRIARELEEGGFKIAR